MLQVAGYKLQGNTISSSRVTASYIKMLQVAGYKLQGNTISSSRVTTSYIKVLQVAGYKVQVAGKYNCSLRPET